MKLRIPLIISLLIIAAMLALSAWAWVTLPAGALMPVHWNIEGQVDRYDPKEIALLVMPGTAVFITFLLGFLPRLEPRKQNLAMSAKLYNVAWIGAMLIMLGAHAAIIAGAMGVAIPMDKIAGPVLGVFFALIGNYLSKTRSNFFAGVRTPWTLSSNYAWEKTHRLAGRLFVLIGVTTVVLSFVAGFPWDVATLVVGILVSVVLTVVMSYVYWRRDPDRIAAAASGSS